jgi:hypothetical protein
MLFTKYLSKTKKVGMSLSFVFGFLLLTFINVNAQSPNNRSLVSRINLADDSDLSRIAKRQGYNDGLKRATKDTRKRLKNPRKASEYKNGTNGFKVYFGSNKDSKQLYGGNSKLYKQAYNEKRKGYQKAYRDGFLEGYSKTVNGNSLDGQSGVTVRKKRSVFGRFRRFILRKKN